MTLEMLNEEITLFTKEHFPDDADKLVFGCGNACSPRVMLIGEAPGGEEVKQGKPFVGKAGKNLDQFLQDAGLSREALYVSNAVKFRPTEAGKNGGMRNRAPKKSETDAFRPFLMREISLVTPRMLVTLGNTPLCSVMGEGFSVGQVHGCLLSGPEGIPLFCLYHPASVIYRPELKEVYRQDMQKLRQHLLHDI